MLLNLKYFKEIDFKTKMHKLPKKLDLTKLYFLVFLLLLSFFYLGAFTSNIKAQVDDFHSLRPYPKSPWNDEVSETALFCGNQLVVSDTISVFQTIHPSLAENCTLIGEDKYHCTYSTPPDTPRSREVTIDLSEASFPIMGNTEDVINSQSQTESLDDAEKTNEYVSWYLSGVINPTEYGFIDPEDEKDIAKIIDFSGPTNKLLPRRMLNDVREETVEEATISRHNQIVGCVTLLGKIVECSQSGSRTIRLTDFKNHLPPKEEEFKDFKNYWIAYKRWRGEICVKIPFSEAFICVNNPLNNYWANLFAEIPLSSTEDRVGLVETETVGVQPVSEDITITNISFSNQEPAELFFAHTEEVSELAKLLQSTYISKDGDWSGTATTGMSPTEACDLVNIRTNPGDDLFAGEIKGTLTYSAEFSCDFDSDDFVGTDSPECKKEVLASLSLITKTPKADEAWSRLVAGPSGIFKRIFPKIGEGGAILGLLDIPGATNVTYSGAGLIYTGNPGSERSGESAELYFPHVGGVSEYFLKGIQTILRPKGFGEQIISGAPGTLPSSGAIDCDQSAPEASLRGTLDKQATFQLALNWVSGQTGNHVLECYNDTVKRSKDAGVNPALALWVWLHESNGSNYNITYEDFGVHHGKPEGFVNQINGFLSRAKSYTPNHYLCAGKNVTPLEAFAYIYASGTCEPTGTTVGSHTAKDFYDALVTQWSWIAPGCPLPSGPTDLSCP
jgi:hypothetical protein